MFCDWKRLDLLSAFFREALELASRDLTLPGGMRGSKPDADCSPVVLSIDSLYLW